MEFSGEKICEVRGEVYVGTPNDVCKDYEPGTIEVWKGGFRHHFRVRKTTGAVTKVCL